MAGLTFDTGALIALERRRARMSQIFAAATRDSRRITVPVAVLAEWWRGRTDLREAIVASCEVEHLTPTLARLAGEAIAAVPGATAVDAIVMASAAQRGDLVYTSDFDDLTALQSIFPSVRVLGV